MCIRYLIVLGTILGVVNCFFHLYHFRWDVTEDKRYSLSNQTCEVLSHLDKPLNVECYLNKKTNSSFRRLYEAIEDMCIDMNRFASINFIYNSVNDSLSKQLMPIVVHEKGRDGKLTQIPIYPYIKIQYGNKTNFVSLLQNNRSLSGADNINHSIECLEYVLTDALNRIIRNKLDSIVFIEGHGELDAQDVYDWAETLKKYYIVTRTSIDKDSFILKPYKAVIVAGGTQKYSETEKYMLDQYIMAGGRVLWLLDGVMLSEKELATKGTTPIVDNSLSIEDMLFKYGVRILPGLVEDIQCLTIPVDVSVNSGHTNFQPIPYYAYPLLLPSVQSSITRGLSQVCAKFVSPIEVVGGDDGIEKRPLLASSTHSKIKKVPSLFQVALNEDLTSFKYAYIPVAMSLVGEFSSNFAHRIPPRILGINKKKSKSVKTKQIVVGGSRLAKNYIVGGKIIPAGFDLYSNIQFGNKDFLMNCVHFLCDDLKLMNLKKKVVKLHLLNEVSANKMSQIIEISSLLVPLLVIMLTVLTVTIIRKHKYCYPNERK